MGKERKWMGTFFKKDVLSTAFSYARHSKSMEELTGFGMTKSSTLTSLAKKYFSSLKNENDETIYTYNDKFMRHFVRQSIKRGRCSALNQYHKSSISDKVIIIILKELDINGNKCEILDKYFEFTNKHRKIIENEYNSQFEDYKDIDHEGRKNYINNKLSKLTLHEKFKKLNVKNFLKDFDATSLYPSAMWDEKSVYPKIETWFAFKPQMKNVYVKAVNDQSFNQDGKKSAISKTKYYNPPKLLFQHLTVKEKVEIYEVDRMRNGYNIDTLTSVDIQEKTKNGGKLIRIYEGVINRENFNISPFRKVI